jgi:hypothetical protein
MGLSIFLLKRYGVVTDHAEMEQEDAFKLIAALVTVASVLYFASL